jgi:PST family polysaccharide transporter
LTSTPTGTQLKQAAVQSAGVTVFSQAVTFAVQMISTVVLARLLRPSDFGVVTMVTTFSVLLVSCCHVGIPDAVLQREKLNHQLATNLFWITVGLGAGLTAAFAASGFLLVRFYGNPVVGPIALGISLTIVCDSMSSMHLALLEREMRFSTVARNEIVSRMISVGVAILCGVAGCGYWALVAGAVAYPISVAVGAWTRCRWIPGLPGREPETGEMVRYAAHVLGRFCLTYLTQNTDNLLVGWRFGSGPLGFYKKAYDLFALPTSLLQVYHVAISTLRRLVKEQAEYRRYFLGGLTVLALIGFGIAGGLTLVAADLVRVVLGPQWHEAGVIFWYFAPGIGVMSVYSACAMIHLSIGTTRRYFRWGIVELAVTGLLFLLTLRWGPRGIAAAWTVSYCVLIIPGFWYAGKPIGLGVTALLNVIWRFMIASVFSSFVTVSLIRAIPVLAIAHSWAGVLGRAISTTIIFGILYIGIVILLYRSARPLHQFWRFMREMGIARCFPWKPSPVIER